MHTYRHSSLFSSCFLSSSLFISSFVFPIMVWWFPFVVAWVFFFFFFLRFYFRVFICGYPGINVCLVIIISTCLNWQSFKFKHSLKIYILNFPPEILCFWCPILYLQVYTFTLLVILTFIMFFFFSLNISQCVKKQRHYFDNKDPCSQSYDFFQ